MAGLVEVSQWEDEIYQLETTDPVEGGPDGIDNRQAKQLANRTQFLKDKFDVTKSPNPLPQYPLSKNAQFQLYEPTRSYVVGDVCYTIEAETGAKTFWEWYSNVESLAGKDPLDTANRRVGWTDVTKPFYWKPYMPKVAGETMYWDTDAIPENMVVGIGQQLPVAVYHSLAAAKPEWIEVTDPMLINIPDRQGRFVRAADGTSWLAGETHEDAIRNITGTFTGATGAIGGAFSGAYQAPALMALNSSTNQDRLVYSFSASNVVPTAEENQPKAFIEWVGYAL